MVNNSSLDTVAATPPAPSAPYAKLALFLVLVPSLLAVLLFLPSGRFDLPFFWAYLILFTLIATAGLWRVVRTHPELLSERRRPAGPNRDPWTRPLATVLIPGAYVLAGFDVGRAHWQPSVPLAIQVLALVLFALTLAVWMWAMSANPFFSSAVRIQEDRGQRVITSGPYRFVRHPGYAAALLVFPMSPLALGSLWAILPTLPVLALFVWRTWLEDRMLHASLPGYSDYAKQVKFCLIPNLW